MRSSEKSQRAFEEASRYFPGGVDSPVRAFKNVGGNPLFIRKGAGSHIYDIDGNDYIDYVLSWGPLILGHADTKVVAALQMAAANGTSYGAPTLLETELAEKIQKIVPSMEIMRMVSSGTEATMSAIRVARGFTKRDKIVKFIGNYHGHSDSLLVDAGSGVATFDINTSPGVPKSLAYDTLTSPYNDVSTIKQIFEKHGDEIACVIVEPVAGNMGVIPGTKEFLQALRDLTQTHGSILIFDEVMSGFRAAYHGAQSLYSIHPDMTTLGKVVGGGLPVGVFGGRHDIMAEVTPQGPIYHAGTLSGNPLAMTGGIGTLDQLSPELYEQMSAKVDHLAKGIEDAAASHNVPVVVHHVGTMWSYFFNQGPVNNFADVQKSDMAFFAKFFNALLDHGIYTAPSEYETNFMSSKHTDAEIDQTIAGFNQSFDDVLKG